MGFFSAFYSVIYSMCQGFPGDSNSKESACNVGDPGSEPGLGRSPGEGNGNPLQYSGQRSLVGYSSWGHKELDTTEWLTLSMCQVNPYYVHFFMTKGHSSFEILNTWFSDFSCFWFQVSGTSGDWSSTGNLPWGVTVICIHVLFS